VRGWRALEQFGDGRRAAPSLVAAALCVYALVSVALPLAEGRDLPRYLLVYAQLFDANAVYPHALLGRTPVTPLVAGGLLDLGPLAAEVGAAFLYACSVLAWSATARYFGPAAAIATAAALLLYPGYVLLFHRLSSDTVFAAGFALLALLVARAFERPSGGRAAALGAGVAGLVLVRPVAQMLLLLVFLPLLTGSTWRSRVRGTVALGLAATVPLVGWSVHNLVRYDDLTVVRGGGTTLPLFRAFVADRIVRPENGPASLALAGAVSRELLPNEPYRSYDIDLDRFFSSGSARMHDDLTVLADRTWGWDDDYAHLARVGREAVLAHPGTYARGVARDLWRLVLWPLYPRIEEPRASDGAGGQEGAGPGAGATEAGVSAPSEGEPIPSSREAPFISTPEGRIREVWTSPTDHHLVFRDAADEQRAAKLDRRVGELLAALPERVQRPGLVRALDELSRWYPRPVVWLLFGLAAVAWRRPRGAAILLVLSACALLLLLTTALAVYAVAEYSVPLVPAFVLLATAGLLGPRSVTVSSRRWQRSA
jgi:hypothetical protein